MSADDLDARIRALVASAADDSPVAPQLPVATAPAVAARERRSWVLAGAALAAAAAVIVAIVMVTRDEPARITPADTTTSTTTVAVGVTWPSGVAVIVASDRGIERVSAEDGHAVVQRLTEPFDASIAFELPDGSLVYQYAAGGIELRHASGARTAISGVGSRLEDARAVAGVVQVAFSRTDQASDGRRTLSIWHGGDGVVAGLPGGSAVQYDRFQFNGDLLLGAWRDDTGRRGATSVALDGTIEDAGLPGVLGVAATDGRTLALVEEGTLVDPRGGEVATLTATDVVAMDLAGDALVLTRTDGTSELTALAAAASYPVPVASGTVTVSLRVSDAPDPSPSTSTPTTAPPPTTSAPVTPSQPIVTAGPDGVSERGPQGEVRWTSEWMATALKAPDGSMIMQRGLQNELASSPADTVPLIQRMPGGPIENLFDVLMPGADPAAGWYRIHDIARVDGHDLLLLERQSVETRGIETVPGVLLTLDLATGELRTIVDAFGGWEEGSSRLHLSVNGFVVGEYYVEALRFLTLQSLLGDTDITSAQLGIADQYSDCSDCPRLYSIDEAGTMIGWLDGTELVLWDVVARGEPRRIDLGDAALTATDLDLGDGFAVLDRRNSGTGPLLVTFDGTTTELAGDRAAIA